MSVFNINPAHVDRDFVADLKTIPGFFGTIIDPAEKSETPSFHAEWGVPRDEWKDRAEYLESKRLALPYYRRHWNNQRPESSCVHNAAEVVRDVMRNKQIGPEFCVKCSPMSSYCRVTRSRNSGSTMWGALQNTKAGTRGNGQVPQDTPRNRELFGNVVFHENSPFVQREQLPAGWEDVAQWFTVVEWYAINSYEEFVSALLNSWGVCYGRSGHSIAGLQAVWYQNQICCKSMCSYGPDRGDQGFIVDTPRNMATGGAWCCREVTLPPDLTKPWVPTSNCKVLTKEQFLAIDGGQLNVSL